MGFKEQAYESNFVYDEQTRYYGLDIFGFHLKTNDLKKSFYLCGVCILADKECYLRSGGLDRKFFMYMEEVDWFWRLNLMGIKFGLSDKVSIHHFRHGSTEEYGTLSSRRFMWRNENTLMMLLKNYSATMLVAILPLYFSIYLVEILYFLIKGRFDIAKTYPIAVLRCLKSYRHIIKSRKIINKLRTINDFQLMKKMYFGSAKLKGLFGL